MRSALLCVLVVFLALWAAAWAPDLSDASGPNDD